jgi:hypothetical protein
MKLWTVVLITAIIILVAGFSVDSYMIGYGNGHVAGYKDGFQASFNSPERYTLVHSVIFDGGNLVLPRNYSFAITGGQHGEVIFYLVATKDGTTYSPNYPWFGGTLNNITVKNWNFIGEPIPLK